jgi:hypothetical protein
VIHRRIQQIGIPRSFTLRRGRICDGAGPVDTGLAICSRGVRLTWPRIRPDHQERCGRRPAVSTVNLAPADSPARSTRGQLPPSTCRVMNRNTRWGGFGQTVVSHDQARSGVLGQSPDRPRRRSPPRARAVVRPGGRGGGPCRTSKRVGGQIVTLLLASGQIEELLLPRARPPDVDVDADEVRWGRRCLRRPGYLRLSRNRTDPQV